MPTGTIGTPSFTARYAVPSNRSLTSRPLRRVPSGNTATGSPAFNAACVAFSAARELGEPRSTGTPPNAVNSLAPSGCLNSSCFAMNRIRRLVTNAANGVSRFERWVGATMYAPDVGTFSVPRTCTRKSHPAQPEDDRAREPVEHHVGFRHLRSEPSDDLGHDLVDRPTRRVDQARIVGAAAAATSPVPSPARRAGPATPAPRRPRSGRSAATSSRWRRCARSSSLAVRNTFTGASGKTTVPMSRPSTTPPPCCSTHARWRATRCRRTCGWADDGRDRRGDLRPADLGARRRRPSSRTVSSSSSICGILARSARTSRRSSVSTRAVSTASVTDRYIAPVSSTCSPSADATPRATVDFPEPDGPSIATTRSVIRASPSSRPARSASKPGYEIATAGQPRTVVSPSAASPATAPHSAIRWSPWLFSVAPLGVPPRTSARRRGSRRRCRAG